MNESGSGGYVAVDAHPEVHSIREVYTAPPSMMAAYRRALFARKPGLIPGVPMPRIVAALPRLDPDLDALRTYRRLTGFTDDGMLPITWPQVLAGSLHAEILTHPRFPLGAMGLVHMHQSITQHAPIPEDAALGLEAWVAGHEKTRRGIEFELRTDVRRGEYVVWQGTTRILWRRASKSSGKRSKPAPPPPGEPAGVIRSAAIRVPENMGRRYGRVSGDLNPIHLTAVSARLFGFRRHIVHGMWSMARCIAELDDDVPTDGVTITTDFKRPVFLPSRLVCVGTRDEEGVGFVLTSPNGRTTHLEGRVTLGAR